jgi:alpha-D-ribose 1-methylphosphonate 5-triphosphate synthase subunit PhnI
MSYVAIKGGDKAIGAAAAASEALRAEEGLDNPSASPIEIEAIRRQLRHLTDRVLSEGGVYHPQFAALAIKQSMGDTFEAGFALRSWRSTRSRLTATAPHDTSSMRLIRRISAAFKEMPGGQMLGATPDYALRLLRLELLDESPAAFRTLARDWLASCPDSDIPTSFPRVLDALRAEGLLPPAMASQRQPFDITRAPLIFPAPRSAALATMARAETGSLLALAYSNMRGYGDVHPTVAELRVGYLPVLLPHPVTGELAEAGEILATECEVIAMYEAGTPGAGPTFTLGYGACFGHNEIKAISMAILDRALQRGTQHGASHPSEDQEFVLLHVDGVDSMGFASHYKMPHYVTFQSDMDRLRATRAKAEERA